MQCRVLVAEGMPSPGGELSWLLRQAGCDVLVGASGPECARLGSERGIDVALIAPDALGPPGYEATARHLRTCEPAIGLVLCVEDPPAQLLVNALRLGFDDVLVRPVSAADVHGAIADLGARVRERRRAAAALRPVPTEPGPQGGDGAATSARAITGAVLRALYPLRPLPAPGGSWRESSMALSILHRLVAHLECARPLEAGHEEPASVTQALCAALRAIEGAPPLGSVEYLVHQASPVPRVPLRPVRLRSILSVLLHLTGYHALRTAKRRVDIELRGTASAACVALRTQPIGGPADDGHDALASLALRSCQRTLEGLGGELSITGGQGAAVQVSARMGCSPGAPRDWGTEAPPAATGGKS